jgi:hypothetical protein
MSTKKLGDKNQNFVCEAPQVAGFITFFVVGGYALHHKKKLEKTPELIRLRAQGRILSEETQALLSKKHGNPINVYEKVSGEFSLIGSFV